MFATCAAPATVVDKILKGEACRSAVERTQFEFVINLKTASRSA
jgi:hypothetical protein